MCPPSSKHKSFWPVVKQSCLCPHFHFLHNEPARQRHQVGKCTNGCLSSFCLDVLKHRMWLLMTNNTNNYSNSNDLMDCHVGCLQRNLCSNSPFWMLLVLLFLCQLFPTVNLFSLRIRFIYLFLLFGNGS